MREGRLNESLAAEVTQLIADVIRRITPSTRLPIVGDSEVKLDEVSFMDSCA
jgi:hypothetical protein